MKILVLGDLILDVYTNCLCERISPEAPVPVLQPRTSEQKLGGAANVALCCAALGAQVHCASVVGADEAAAELAQAMRSAGIKPLLLQEGARQTSRKIRLLASGKQVARLDYESTQEITASQARALLELCDERYDAVIISDYAKGVITAQLAASAQNLSALVLADPKKSLAKLAGCSVITPNLKEARLFAGEFCAADDEQLLAVLRSWQRDFGVATPVLTLSEQGIAALDGEQLLRSRALSREVSDVTGAGDSVIAALAAALAGGLSLAAALDFANAAASVCVNHLGTYAPNIAQIRDVLAGRANAELLGFLARLAGEDVANAAAEDFLPVTAVPPPGGCSANSSVNTPANTIANSPANTPAGCKIMSLEQAVRFASQHAKPVWTNGCFDILHAGHCSYLARARELGDCLIVGLNSDESVRALKGPERPINPAADRAAVLAALASVDAVVIFDAPTPLECIRALRPAVLAKGADYSPEQVIGREFAGELALIEFLPGRSSSKIIKKCKEEK